MRYYGERGSNKIASGIVDESVGKLPYFGITKNAVVASAGTNGRYAQNNPRAQNLLKYRGILGKTNYFTAAGVEAALIALNTYLKNFEKKVVANQHSSADVKNSTRIDNKMFSNKSRTMIESGIQWLRGNYGKNWKSKFLHNENKKGKNNTTR